MVTQGELEGLVLFALYGYYQKHSDSLEIGQVKSLLDEEVSNARVQMALRVLTKDGHVYTSMPMISGQRTTYTLTETGYKYAEGLDSKTDSDDDLETKSAPAAGRIVGFDHNSSEFREVLSKTEELKTQLQDANDVGQMSPRAVEVAVAEVEQIDQSLRLDFFRPAHIWRIAQSTLKWIGEQAAGALVGQLAVGLLILLAAILGISVT